MPYSPAGSINNYGLGSMTTNSVTNAGIYAAMGSYTVQAVYDNACLQGAYFGQGTQTAAFYESMIHYVYTQQTVYTTGCVNSNVEFIPETEEQKADRLKREAEWKEKRERAAKRARETLVFLLDFNQREQLEKENAFELTVDDRRYRIRPGRKVERLNAAGKVTSFLCAHPPSELNLPNDDIAISQKLWLETDEKGFLAIANETKCGIYDDGVRDPIPLTGDAQVDLAA